MLTPQKVEDPALGEFYRATCENCGKVFESKSVKQVLYNYTAHRGTHNGHS